VQLPQTNIVDLAGENARSGAAYLALRMNSESSVAAGSMLYAGVLPNGRAVYGSRTLIEDAKEGVADLPFYHFSDMKTAGYVFSGGLRVKKNAATTYKTDRWSVTAVWLPVWETTDGYAHASAFNVYGGYYDQDELYDRFMEDYTGETGNFALIAETATLVSGRYGTGSAMAAVRAEMTETEGPKLKDEAENPQEATLNFSLETGVVSGEYYIPFGNGNTAVTFRGIALPGWQGCSTCTSLEQRPWAVGACSFSDRATGVGTYRNGCEVRLDRFQ